MTNTDEGGRPPLGEAFWANARQLWEEINRMPSNPPEGGSLVASTHAARYASYRAARVAVEPREPRCRICRDSEVRRLVNDLLDWRGVPIIREDGKRHRVTLSDIVRSLEPLNEGRDEMDQITYSSVRVHFRRHFDTDGIADYWSGWFCRELRNALGGRQSVGPIAKIQTTSAKYEKPSTRAAPVWKPL